MQRYALLLLRSQVLAYVFVVSVCDFHITNHTCSVLLQSATTVSVPVLPDRLLAATTTGCRDEDTYNLKYSKETVAFLMAVSASVLT
jgi:hypothetical protein